MVNLRAVHLPRRVPREVSVSRRRRRRPPPVTNSPSDPSTAPSERPGPSPATRHPRPPRPRPTGARRPEGRPRRPRRATDRRTRKPPSSPGRRGDVSLVAARAAAPGTRHRGSLPVPVPDPSASASASFERAALPSRERFRACTWRRRRTRSLRGEEDAVFGGDAKRVRARDGRPVHPASGRGPSASVRVPSHDRGRPDDELGEALGALARVPVLVVHADVSDARVGGPREEGGDRRQAPRRVVRVVDDDGEDLGGGGGAPSGSHADAERAPSSHTRRSFLAQNPSPRLGSRCARPSARNAASSAARPNDRAVKYACTTHHSHRVTAANAHPGALAGRCERCAIPEADPLALRPRGSGGARGDGSEIASRRKRRYATGRRSLMSLERT